MRHISPVWMDGITDSEPGLKWAHPLAADLDGEVVSWLPLHLQLPSQKSNSISSITFYSTADSLAENVWASEWRHPSHLSPLSVCGCFCFCICICLGACSHILLLSFSPKANRSGSSDHKAHRCRSILWVFIHSAKKLWNYLKVHKIYKKPY